MGMVNHTHLYPIATIFQKKHTPYLETRYGGAIMRQVSQYPNLG